MKRCQALLSCTCGSASMPPGHDQAPMSNVIAANTANAQGRAGRAMAATLMM